MDKQEHLTVLTEIAHVFCFEHVSIQQSMTLDQSQEYSPFYMDL
jgi:hypothetical protein